MTKRFFYVCAGLFLLALSWHFGAMSAGAQVGAGNPVVAQIAGTCPNFTTVVVTANGDIYGSNYCSDTWTHIGNVFNGGPVPTNPATLGQVKVRYR